MIVITIKFLRERPAEEDTQLCKALVPSTLQMDSQLVSRMLAECAGMVRGRLSQASQVAAVGTGRVSAKA